MTLVAYHVAVELPSCSTGRLCEWSGVVERSDNGSTLFVGVSAAIMA